MKNTSRTICLAALCCTALTTVASADITFSDPGLYENLDDRFEARIRLDGGSSQTWKTAFWDEDSLISHSGIHQNVFEDGHSYGFAFDFDASTGQADLSVAGLELSETIMLDPGMELAGFYLFLRSETGTGLASASNLLASVNNGPAQALDGLTSGVNDGWVTGPMAYVDGATDQLALTGDVTFDWQPDANLQGDRFKLGVKIVQGSPIPAPGAIALLGLAGIVGRRRRP
jgi:MYXO-CTERM domain-containing protein